MRKRDGMNSKANVGSHLPRKSFIRGPAIDFALDVSTLIDAIKFIPGLFRASPYNNKQFVS